VTHVARDVDIGQELHLDLQHALTFALLAAPAAHVEAVAPGAVAAHLAFRQFGKQRADRVEDLRIRAGIAARRPANRTLVDVDDLVDVVQPVDPGVLCRGRSLLSLSTCATRLYSTSTISVLFAAPAHARDADHLAERKLHVDVF